MTPVTVAIHAADAFTEAGLTSRLKSRNDIRVVPREKLSHNGVLVMAIDQFRLDEVKPCRRRAAGTRLATVLVTDSVVGADAQGMVSAGVTVLLTRAEASTDRFVSAILAAAGGADVQPGFGVQAARPRTRPVRSTNAQELTPREISVLKMMADGLCTAQIAIELCYSDRTVKNIIHRMISRLNVRSRQQAVAHAYRAGLI